MRIVGILTIAALAVAGPPLIGSELEDGQGAAFAKGKNGNKGGGRGGGNRGNRGGNENANRKGGGGPPAANGAARRPAANNAAARPAAVQRPARAETAAAPVAAAPGTVRPVARQRNLHAQLKGLNSLNRNINGLMNSSDPKMDGFRAFVTANAAVAQAQAYLEADQALYDQLTDEFAITAAALGVSPVPFEAEAQLTERLQALRDAPVAETDPAYGQYLADITAIEEALADLAEIDQAGLTVIMTEEAVMLAEEAAGQDDLIQAMVDGLNATGAGPVTEADLTPEMIEWVEERLGVDDATGLIDDYIAQQAAEAAAVEEEAAAEDAPETVETPDPV